MHWSRRQVRAFAADIRRAWGGVWPHVGQDLREALVDARVTIVCSGQDRTDVPVEAITELQAALRAELGLSEA